MFFSSALRKLKMYQNINIWTGFSISHGRSSNSLWIYKIYKRRTTKCTKWPFLVIKLWFIIQILPSPWHNMWKCEENFYWTKKGLNSKFPKLMERHTMTLLVCQKVWQKCQQYFLNYSQQSCVMMSPLYHSLFCPNTENTLIEDIYFLLGLFLGLFP